MEVDNKETKEKQQTDFKKLEEATNNLGHKIMTISNETQKLTNLIVCGSEEMPETAEKAEERPRAENRIVEVMVKVEEYIKIADNALVGIRKLKEHF